MCTDEMLDLFHCFVGNIPQNLSFKFIILFSISTKFVTQNIVILPTNWTSESEDYFRNL